MQPENEATAHWSVVIDLKFSKNLETPHLKLPPVEGWEVEGDRLRREHVKYFCAIP